MYAVKNGCFDTRDMLQAKPKIKLTSRGTIRRLVTYDARAKNFIRHQLKNNKSGSLSKNLGVFGEPHHENIVR